MDYDVTKFGALGDGRTDDTGAVRAAVAAAGAGGVVLFPPGTFRVGSIEWSQNVTLRGAGADVSVLKSNAAETMLTLAADRVTHVNGVVRDLTLDGAFQAPQGLCFRHAARFFLDRVIVQNFTTRGLDVVGSLVFQATRCQILNCGIGIEGATSPGADANLVALRDCVITSNRRCGVRWRSGSMLLLDGCDLEDNGTAGDDAASALHVSGLCAASEGIGLVVDRCWFEGNHGHSAVWIDPPASSGALHVIQNSQIFAGNRRFGVYVDGTRPTRYFLQNVVAQNAFRADFYDGAAASGFLLNSFATCSLLRGASTQWPLATTDNETSLRAATGISFWTGAPGGEPSARLDAQGGGDDTRLLLFDVSAGTLKRVSRGPKNSAGKGYRALRIPN